MFYLRVNICVSRSVCSELHELMHMLGFSRGRLIVVDAVFTFYLRKP